MSLLSSFNPQIAEASHLGKIPDGLSFQQAAPVLCAGVTTYAALKATEVKPGQFLTVIGGEWRGGAEKEFSLRGPI